MVLFTWAAEVSRVGCVDARSARGLSEFVGVPGEGG
jgi:hypothetical protein